MIAYSRYLCLFFFFQAEDGIRDLTVTGVQTCALPIFSSTEASFFFCFSSVTVASNPNKSSLNPCSVGTLAVAPFAAIKARMPLILFVATDRKSTRLNSSHSQISYAVFCLKKKNINSH